MSNPTCTIHDVAKEAGVSITTVSHVINKTRFVSEELANRVNAAIGKLHYQPSSLARGLRTNTSGTIGIVIPDSTNPFFAEVVRGIEDYCYKKGYSAFLCNSDGKTEKEYCYLQILREKSVDGIVLVSSGDNQDSQELLGKSNIPYVIIDRQVPFLKADTVLIDNYKGGYDAASHLISLGHRSIGCITGPSQVTPSWQRRKGYTQALQDHGLPMEESLIIQGDFKSGSGREGLRRFLEMKSPPTAIFACNDIMAIGAMAAARERGISVPDHISIIGFDDIALASLVVPQLTTVSQPKKLLGKTGAKLLLRRIKQEQVEKEDIVLQPELIIRSSTAEHSDSVKSRTLMPDHS